MRYVLVFMCFTKRRELTGCMVRRSIIFMSCQPTEDKAPE